MMEQKVVELNRVQVGDADTQPTFSLTKHDAKFDRYCVDLVFSQNIHMYMELNARPIRLFSRASEQKLPGVNGEGNSLPAHKQEEEQQLHACHQQKQPPFPQEAQNPHRQILMPLPAGHYCAVCREKFDRYEKHIEHPFHLHRLQTDPKKKILQQLIERDKRQLRELQRQQALRRRLSLEQFCDQVMNLKSFAPRKVNPNAIAKDKQASQHTYHISIFAARQGSPGSKY